MFLERLDAGMMTVAEILKDFRLENVYRLQVETHVMDIYLSRQDWLERLRPDLEPNVRDTHFAHFQGRNDRLKASIAKFLFAKENAAMSPG